MRIISKGQLWLLLGPHALQFAAFLNKSDPADPLTTTAQNLKVIWDSITGFDWDSALMQQQLVPLLESQGIIDASVIAACQAYVDTEYLPPSF